MAKVALLIGVGEYGAGLSALPGAIKDVEAMQRVLQHPEMGQFDHIKTLLNPTPLEMQGEIEHLCENRTRDDLILLFFSGHGVKDDSNRLYFATTITRKTTQGELVKSTAVPSSFVNDVMRNSRSKRQVVLLDCCFSGAFAEDMKAKDDGSVDVQTQLGCEGRAVLTSSSSTQYSFEQQGSDLSVYTRFLVEGIETGAADQDGDGVISINELHDYATRKVQESAPAMKPKIYAVEEGFKIRLSKAPVGDPKLNYRKEVERFAKRGEISDVARYTLDARQGQLGISSAEAQEIEDQVLKPYQEYKQKLQQYEEVLARALERKNPLPKHTREELRRFQEVLGLEDKDVNSIESRLALSREEAQSQSVEAASPQSLGTSPSNVQPQHRVEIPFPREPEADRAEGSLRQTTTQFLSRQPRRLLLFLSIAIASFLLVIGIWLLPRSTPNVQTVNDPSPNPILSSPAQPTSIEARMSVGNKILMNKEEGDPEKPAFEAAKQKGADAMANQDYKQAVTAYTEAIEAYRNAPETLIYLNNARIGAEKSYTIAAPVPITSSKPNNALEMLRGLAQAQNEINKAGGINGVGLKLKIFDDSDDPEIVKQVASEIVRDPEILGGLGHWSSSVSLAAAPIYFSGKIPFITPISTVTQLSKYSPYFLRTNLNTDRGGKALADYALTRLKKKNIAIFFDKTSAYSKELESRFSADIKTGGGKITESFNLPDSSLSIAKENIDKAMSQGAEAILLIPAPTSLDKAIEVIAANRKRLPLFGDLANLQHFPFS